MMIWTLEVEDIGCPVDDMKKVEVFTFFCSESERMELWEREEKHRVRIDGRVESLSSPVTT